MWNGLCIKIRMRLCRQSAGLSRALTWGTALLLCAAGARAESTPVPHGSVELIADHPWIAAGHDFDLGLRFQLEKGWHIYWVNPGDSGQPPRVTWHLPAGLTAGAIDWPAPRRLVASSSVVDYGYEDAVLLPVPMHVAASLAAQPQVRLDADLKLLICSHEMCVPGKAQLALTLLVKSLPPAPDSQTAALFAAARKSLPRPAPRNWKFAVADTNDAFILTGFVGHEVKQATFFPLVDSEIENAAPQKLQPKAGGFELTLGKSDQLLKPIDRLKGVLTISAEHANSDESYLMDAPVGRQGRGSSAGAIQPVK
jgi:DsbC/DsbD-like thiol-disulfide interchange protein